MDIIHKGGLGGTFCGNPISCAGALAAIKIIKENDLVSCAEHVGEKVRSRFSSFYDKYKIVGDVRGLGAMNAIELVRDRNTKTPVADAVPRILKYCYENGLIVLKAGTYGNCIRTLMPLVISNEQLNDGLDILEEAVNLLNMEL